MLSICRSTISYDSVGVQRLRILLGFEHTMSERVLALIHYYAREGLHRQVQNVCNEVLKTRANDSTLVFWRAACGLLPEGNTSEVRD